MTTTLRQFPFVATERKKSARPLAKKRKPDDSPERRWLGAIKAIHNLSDEELGDRIGVGRSAATGYSNGNTIPPAIFTAILAAFPDVPPLEGVALPGGGFAPRRLNPLGPAQYLDTSPYREILYAGVVPASTWGDPLSADTTIEVDSKFAGKNRFATRVIGDSCFPALMQGDTAIWESDRNPPHGVIVIAERHEDDGCTVKQLGYDEETMTDVLKPINPRYENPPHGMGWRATARLVGVIRKHGGPERTWYEIEGLRPADLIRKAD